jgi:DNA-binding transcriptional regulator YiaG
MYPPLTPDEITFLERMRPHLAAGKGLEDSARAVIADDIRLLEFLVKQPQDGDFRASFAAEVYWRLKPRQLLKGQTMTADELKAARHRLGLSVEGLAKAMRLGGDGGRTIRKWEDGEKPVPGWAAFIIGLILSREWPTDWPAPK